VHGIVASVDGLQPGDGSWALCVLLELKQRARLSRDPGRAFDATTWSGKLPAVSTTAELKGTCCELFRHLANELGGILQAARLEKSEAG